VPIYEYQCTSCAHRFEVKQSIKDEPIKECVRCGKEVTKLISSPAIMFKGSGWYITDYSDKMKPGSGSDTSEKPAASSTDKTKAPASSEGGGTSSTTTPAPALRQLRARRHRRVQVHPHPARAHQAQAPHRPQAPSRFLTDGCPPARFSTGDSQAFPAHPPQAVQTRCPMEPQRSLRRDDRGAPGRWTPARRYADSVLARRVPCSTWRP
jgi:putative FmdB family regulatory protein